MSSVGRGQAPAVVTKQASSGGRFSGSSGASSNRSSSTAEPPSPSANVLIRPTSGTTARRQSGTRAAVNGASSNAGSGSGGSSGGIPANSPTNKSGSTLPRLAEGEHGTSSYITNNNGSNSGGGGKSVASSPSFSPLSPSSAFSPPLPSLLEQTLSENRRFSNGMSPIPSGLMGSGGGRPGSAGGDGNGTGGGSGPAYGRRASKPPSRSNSPGGGSNGSGEDRGVSHFNHAAANARDNGEPDFEMLDDQLSKSSVFRELHRVVRMCAAQPSCDRMVMTLERQTRYLINASCVRLFLVQRDGLVHYSRQAPFHLNQGIVGFVRARKEIVHLTSPALDDRFNAEIDQVHDRPTPTALMCVPVEADSRPDAAGPKDIVAVFQAFREGPGDSFTSRDCKVLYRLGEFAGNMLRNSRSVDRAHALYNASLQSHKRSAALLDVAKALASETDLSKVVGIIVSQVPELLDSDRCTLFFVDREKEQLIVTKGASKGRAKNLVSWIFGQSNAPELPFPQGRNEIRFSMHNGIAGHVAMSGETLNIVDAHQDPRFNSTMDKETGYRTRSMLCVPMVDSVGAIIGVIQAINKNNMFPRFDGQDETLLKTFAAQAALAVRNAQLFTKTVISLKQSDALLEVTKALSQELKIEALIQIICSKVQALLHSERCTVFILDKERKELYTSAHMSFGMGPALPIDGERATLIFFPMDRGIAGSVATTLQPVNIPDAYKDPRFNKNMDKETGFRTRSILCMPIVNNRNDCVGVLQVMNKEGSTFDEPDEKLLSAFCAQAAVAIENSRLFLQTERALNHALADQRNMKFMLSVTKNLFSDMHLTSMIDQMTMQVHHLLKADDCIAEGTLVNIAGGYAVPIETVMAASGSKGLGGDMVLGLSRASGGTDGVETRLNAATRRVGQRECVELLLEDGRTLVCTPDHLVYTSSGSWVPADKLHLNHTNVAVGVEYPALMKLEAHTQSEVPWSRTIASFELDMDSNMSQSLAFARVLGFLLSSSSPSTSFASSLHVQHRVDLESVLVDLRCLCDGQEAVAWSQREDRSFDIVLPQPLHAAFLAASSSSTTLPTAPLSSTSFTIPSFILAPECPQAIVREFLGGLFGAESGHSLSYDDAQGFRGLAFFTADSDHDAIKTHLPSLLARCGVTAVSGVQIDTVGSECSLRITGSEAILQFARGVGFRYASHKQLRLTAGAAFFRAGEYVHSQRHFLRERVQQLQHMSLSTALDQAKSELADRQVIHPDVASWSPSSLELADSSSPPTDSSMMSLTASKALTSWNIAKFFSSSSLPSSSPSSDAILSSSSPSSSSLPLFQVPIIGRRSVGLKTVYDLSVPARVKDADPSLPRDHFDSFMAAGVVVHNCAVYLVDDATKEFWLAKDDTHAATNPAASSTSSGEIAAKKFGFAVGIVGVVAASGDTIRISSGAHSDPRFSALVDQRKGKTTHSILCCPIKAELPDGASKIVGVISVRDEKDRGGFEQEEEKLLKVFCAQAAVAIMNSKRFATIMDQAEIKSTSDHSAADYLKQNRGMKLASDDINLFQFKMEDIKMRGAIGTGSYGEVYKAEVNGGQVVAVKKLHVRNLKAEQVDAFCKEASLMCQLNHTNIVGFIGAVTEPSNLCIITEYCSRGSLADLLLDDKIWMNFRVKVKFALEAAEGMLYLHNSNPVILHRDLKSDNLLVTESWSIKVADFGLTRFISEKKQMTQVGTPMWMAPEIIMGRKYTEKADVYAFGIILWEILTRLEPYEEKEPMQIVVEVVNDGLRPTLPAECAESPLVPLMKDCWHTDPIQRPPFEKICDRLRIIQNAIKPDDNTPCGLGANLSKAAQLSAHGANIAGDSSSPPNL